MKNQSISKRNLIILFLSVGLFADLLPWPGLGNGLIHSLVSSIGKEEAPQEQVLKARQPQ